MNSIAPFFPYQVFRAYDIRGRTTQLDAKLIAAIAQAFAQLFKLRQQHQIVLGYDARLSSPTYAKIIRDVLASEFEVIELGCCSTPQMYFAAHCYQGNGVMVTASHNPKTDNGLKWVIQGEPPTPEAIQLIGQTALQAFVQTKKPLPVDPVAVHQFLALSIDAYEQFILKDIHLDQPVKVVIDGLNGSAGFAAKRILQKFSNVEVVALRCEPNGNFPDHAPDPSVACHLTRLQQKVIEQQANLGIALDGDGDRVVLLDEQGRIISADQMLALLAEICLPEHPDREVVFDVKCSTMVRQSIEAAGGTAKMLRTGSSFLRRYIQYSHGQAILGGEYAGHYVFNDGRGLGFDDGLYAALRVMEYMNQTKRSLSSLMGRYPQRYYTEDTYISTRETNPDLVLKELAQRSEEFDAELSKIDGVRLDFSHGFGIMRASNTGDFFTVRFDADSQARLNTIRQTFVTMLCDRYPLIAQDISNIQ
ncbi:phosphomannomutase/phosphoglucomutase [Acinetobacter rudis]|uniref:phosphomannomutase n=1 Tax=Acinetobacter rudis TaxID=632955 RepID=A0AAW8J784_9GAMM|nr:phosphomannomutase/phosphoglucomutase [Acinetobacter rudis]MDQ8935040.1 phosphomannomutase/phosphoglucomutase [Acinetobacter rudis]MDQ9017405.1 phosphomannomutase/phosphoglucomutase [Acinetobacter rudis]